MSIAVMVGEVHHEGISAHVLVVTDELFLFVSACHLSSPIDRMHAFPCPPHHQWDGDVDVTSTRYLQPVTSIRDTS